MDMSNDERATMPPTSADTEALSFAKRLAVAEQKQRRTKSGILRACAEAWFSLGCPGQRAGDGT